MKEEKQRECKACESTRTAADIRISHLTAERDSWKYTAIGLEKALQELKEKVATNVDLTACEVIGEYWKADETLKSYKAMRV
jgi:hypothetical protein